MHLSTLVETAADLRRKSGQLAAPYSTHRIIEAAFPDALVTGRRMPKGVLEAVSRTDKGPVILYARGLPTPKQRFVIAHAVGHLVFDKKREYRHPGQRRIPRVEQRADDFADELLVPLLELRPLLHHLPSPCVNEHDLYLDQVDQISSVFGVPAKVIQRRIRQLLSQVRILA